MPFNYYYYYFRWEYFRARHSMGVKDVFFVRGKGNVFPLCAWLLVLLVLRVFLYSAKDRINDSCGITLRINGLGWYWGNIQRKVHIPWTILNILASRISAVYAPGSCNKNLWRIYSLCNRYALITSFFSKSDVIIYRLSTLFLRLINGIH